MMDMHAQEDGRQSQRRRDPRLARENRRPKYGELFGHEQFRFDVRQKVRMYPNGKWLRLNATGW